jgi:hypothetical protein
MTRPMSNAERSYARGTAIAAIFIAVSWHIAFDLSSTVTGWNKYQGPALVGAAWVVTAVLIGIGSVVLLRPDDRRPLWPAAVGVPLLLLCSVVVIRATPSSASPGDAGLFAAANWAWGSFGWFALVLLWRWPLRWLISTIVLNMVVVVATLVTAEALNRVSFSRLTLTTYGTLALQFGVAGGALALQRTARRTVTAANERVELDAARQAADEVHADRARRYREVGQAVRAVLAGLAQGALDPSDPEVQRRSAIGASRLRRLIAEHDGALEPLMHELRACADVAERRDVAVTLEVAGDLPALPVQVRRALTEAPMYLLAAARTQARVTVVSAADGQEVEVSVVADCGPGPADAPGGLDGVDLLARHEDVEVTWSSEGGTWWVRARWRDR